MSRMSRIISSLSRVIPSHTPSFLPLPVLIIHSFALSLTESSSSLSLPSSVYSISHHDMTAFSQFEFTNGKTDRPRFALRILKFVSVLVALPAPMLTSHLQMK